MKRTAKKVVSGIVRHVHDADCPKCGFPETVIIRNIATMEPIIEECSDKNCDWGRVLAGVNLKRK